MTSALDKARIVAAGAGRMGQGIALAFAYAGHPVDLVDLKRRAAEESIALGQAVRGRVQQDLKFLNDLGALPGGDIDRVVDRIRLVGADAAAEAIAAGEIIFEAVPETLTAKRAALDFLFTAAQPEAILASTTSTFDARLLAGLVTRPERFVNAHWLNPAHLMPLVEVSPCETTATAALDRLLSVLRSIGKVPVVCKSSPGYIVPRIQSLAMNEAARMVEEGIASAEDIDTAVKVGFGLRFAVLGLLEFIDWGGGDILYYASRNLAANLDPARFAAPGIVQRNMRDGRRGLRDARGFFDYSSLDIERYRSERLGAFVALLRHLNLMPIPAEKTAPD